MGSVLAANLRGPMRTGFTAAASAGWWIIAVSGVTVILLALVTTSRAGKASAQRAAELIETAEEKVLLRN